MHLPESMQFLLPFLASAGMVTLNEMGDKTQLLAMAMATRIKFWKVMLGVLIATLLNHGIAVLAGALLASVPGWQGWVQLTASVLFIVFGLWALISDQGDDGPAKRSRLGDVATVATAFFIAEMGDKTQLATIALAATYRGKALLVLAGTTTGMLIADGIGIFIGVILNRHLPGGVLKLFAAATFVFFGLVNLYETLSGNFHLGAGTVLPVVAAATAVSVGTGALILRGQRKKG